MPKENSLFYFVAINDEGISSRVVTRAYNYAPDTISYDQAIDKLTNYLISIGKFDYGEFENGDVGYLEYNDTMESDSEDYYIIDCEIEDKDGNSISSSTYSISRESGEIQEGTPD